MTTIPKTKRKKGFKPVGIFLFGMFFGLLFTLGAIFGVGFWAYKNLTLNKIEKITKNEIDIGNESIKNVSLETIIKNVSGIVKNIDTYTIGQLEKDFEITIIGENGYIPETLYGLDLTSLRNSTKNTISDDLEKIIDGASLDTVINYMKLTDDELGMFGTIINTDITYYYNPADRTLYAKYDESSATPYTEKVGFDYTIDGNKIDICGKKYTLTDNKITISFRNVPIEQAFSDFNAVTDNLKVYKVLGYYENSGKYYTDSGYTNEVTGFMATIAGKNVNDLDQDFIDNTYLYEAMGFYCNNNGTPDDTSDDKYFKNFDGSNYSDELTGVLKALAPRKIKDLENDSTFNDLYIYEVMDYKNISGVYYEKPDGSTEYSQKVGGVMGAIAGSQIKNLKNDINDIELGQALDIEYNSASGTIKALYTTKISEINANINNLTIAQVMDYHKNPSDEKYYENFDGTNYTGEVTGVMKAIADFSISELSNESKIDSIKISDVLNLTGSETGALNAIKDSTIGSLSDDINNLTVSQVMGYYCDNNGTPDDTSDDRYYQNYDGTTYTNEVKGIMGAIAGTKINNLSAKIDTLTLTQIISHYKEGDVYYEDETKAEKVAILNLLGSDAETTTVSDISSVVTTKINTLSLGELVDKGIIDVGDLVLSTEIRGMTIYQIVETVNSLS